MDGQVPAAPVAPDAPATTDPAVGVPVNQAEIPLARSGVSAGHPPASADPDPQHPAHRVRLLARRLVRPGDDREALRWWVLSRLAALWIASQAGWLFARSNTVPAYLERWYTWDSQYYVKIAQYGYDGPPGNETPLEAFFPGMPLLLRAVHLVVRDWTLAGLLISFVAGAVAVVALSRLAVLELGERAGGRAALLFCVSPLTVFMAAGYTEALFLAFAIPAWLQARRGRWAVACVLAAGASSVRITGLFLAVALVVEYASGRLPQRIRPRHHPAAPPWRALPWLAVPFLPILAYSSYLRVRTGDWTYWLEAQAKGWNRHFTGFTKTFESTWNAAFHSSSPNFQWAFRVELIAVALGVALVAVLLARARFGEAVYVGASLLSLTTSTWYFSVGRAALLWWPLWIGLAALAIHRRHGTRFTQLYVFASAPLAVLAVAAFTTWRWVG